MKKLRLLGLACSLAVLNQAPVAAQPMPEADLDADKIIATFNPESVDAPLRVVTGNHYLAALPNGQTFLSATSPKGIGFSVLFLQCEAQEGQEQQAPSQCGAVQLLTTWESGSTPDANAALVLESAPKSLFVNLGVLPDGRPYMSRIILVGNGLAQGNLLAELRGFLDAAEAFNGTLLAQSSE